MKLYIPTTTLNIDNILSTECIAPLSFYKEREYGYNQFYKIACMPYQKVQLFFSKIPHFETNDFEHHAFPLVIELTVSDNKCKFRRIKEVNGVEVFQTDDIVRLTPYNTRVLFFNPTALNAAILCCSDSLTNKLGDRYSYNLCRPEFDLVPLIEKVKVDDVCSGFHDKVLQDNRLNKVKGFIFGYYLGVAKSISTNSAKLLKIQKRIYDIVASIKNDGMYNNSAIFDELSQLDAEYKRNDPTIKQCKEEWNKYLENLHIPPESMEIVLKDFDMSNGIKTSFMRKNGFVPSVSLMQYGFNNLDGYRNALTTYTTSLVNSDRKKLLDKFSDSIKSTFDLDPSYETCMLAKDDEDATLFNRFIDRILWRGQCPTPETLRTDRFNIATEITKIAKSIWEDTGMQWQESKAQAFMNELRQNIKNFTPLNMNGQDSLILKSVATYVLKGEDYDSLIQFCIDNSISDYRYALALWGATQGYVKISRPIIGSISKSNSFNSTLKEIIFLLHNIESVGDLPNMQEAISVTTGTSKLNTIVSNTNVNIASPKSDLNGWQDSIREYFLNEIKNVRNKKGLLSALEKAFEKNRTRQEYASFFAILNDYQEWKTSKGEPVKAWKDLVAHFCPNEYNEKFVSYQEQQTPKKKERGFVSGIVDSIQQGAQQVLSLFTEETQNVENETVLQNIIYDASAVKYIENCPYIAQHKSHFVDLFIEFQRSYQSGYYYSKKEQYHRNNNDVVDHFCRWCLYQGNKKAIPMTPDNRKMVESLKEYLLTKYHD